MARPLIQLLGYDPGRTPTWKWELAQQILDHGLDLKVYDDPAVFAAHGFLSGLRGEKHELIEEAHKLHDLNNPQTWEICARILARQSDQAIAKATGCSAKVVFWFEALFFNVRSVLDARDFISIRVLGGGGFYGFQDDDIRGFWSWIAYGGGPIAFDHALENYRKVKKKGQPFRLSDYFRKDSPLSLSFQSFVAERLLPATPEFDELILNLWWKYGPLGKDLVQLRRFNKEVIRIARRFVAGKPIRHPRRSKQMKATRASGIEITNQFMAQFSQSNAQANQHDEDGVLGGIR